jgi:hypothetical protein
MSFSKDILLLALKVYGDSHSGGFVYCNVSCISVPRSFKVVSDNVICLCLVVRCYGLFRKITHCQRD